MLYVQFGLYIYIYIYIYLFIYLFISVAAWVEMLIAISRKCSPSNEGCFVASVGCNEIR